MCLEWCWEPFCHLASRSFGPSCILCNKFTVEGKNLEEAELSLYVKINYERNTASNAPERTEHIFCLDHLWLNNQTY